MSIQRRMVVSSLSLAASEIILLALLSRGAAVDRSGVLSSFLYAAFFLGSTSMGIAGGVLLQRLSAPALGRTMPVLNACTALIVASLLPSRADLCFGALVGFFTALENPIINTTLSRSLPTATRASSVSSFQTWSSTLVLAAPLAGAASIEVIGADMTIRAASVLLILSTMGWYRMQIPRSESSRSPSAFRGYKLVATNKPLRKLTIARLLNNLFCTAIPVVLPLLISRFITDVGDFAWLQGVALAAYRAGTLAAGITGAVLLRSRPHLAVSLAQLATPVGVTSLLVLSICSSFPLAVIAFTGAGVGVYAVRASGLTLGPCVTPREYLADVILASDTIVRVQCAIYSSVLATASALLGGPSLVLILAAVASVPAPFFLRPAIRAYYEQLGYFVASTKSE